jgi:hypothetical protein
MRRLTWLLASMVVAGGISAGSALAAVPQNTTQPSIEGKFMVGVTVNANRGTWSNNRPATSGYAGADLHLPVATVRQERWKLHRHRRCQPGGRTVSARPTRTTPSACRRRRRTSSTRRRFRFKVAEANQGKAVAGAPVYAIAVPSNQVTRSGEVQTDSSGFATIRFQPLKALPMKAGHGETLRPCTQGG